MAPAGHHSAQSGRSSPTQWSQARRSAVGASRTDSVTSGSALCFSTSTLDGRRPNLPVWWKLHASSQIPQAVQFAATSRRRDVVLPSCLFLPVDDAVTHPGGSW